jgi:Zn finger protein HypA/HybF involved in hydrogenase expression
MNGGRADGWLGGRRRQCDNCENHVFEEYLDEGCPACRS